MLRISPSLGSRPQALGRLTYSYLSASTGFIFEARSAGKMPEKKTNTIMMEINATRMSPEKSGLNR
jgi:hypothetical protein